MIKTIALVVAGLIAVGVAGVLEITAVRQRT